MEQWQKVLIEDNLDELISETRCNTVLLAKFRAKNVLSKEEGDYLLRADLGEAEKSNRLYDILITRVGSFGILIECLKETRQSGAIKILTENEPAFVTTGRITYDENRLLGEGNSGMVFQGTFGSRDVAVKVMRANLVNAAKREIHLLEMLDIHENIVRYFAAEAEKKYIYIALELCVSTLEVAVKCHRQDLHATEILKQCTKGLAFLHDKNVIHCDLKPSNILLTESRQVKISDFGLAKEIHKERKSITVNTGAKGTVDWMAPELLEHLFSEERGKQDFKMTTASDVFSLGCIFFFMLTRGSHPFGKAFERQNNIYSNKPNLNNDYVCNAWQEVIKRLISHDATTRPTTISVLDLLSAASERHCTTCPNSNHIEPRNEPMQLAASGKNVCDVTADCRQNQTCTISSGNSKGAFTKVPPEDFWKSTQGTMASSSDSPPKLNVKANDMSRFVNKTEDNSTHHSPANINRGVKSLFEYMPLPQAISQGMSREGLEYIVNRGSDWTVINMYGESMLHLAAANGNLDAIKYFAGLGADVNLKDQSGKMPIHKVQFPKENSKNVLDILLECGADINAKGWNKYTPIHLAVLLGMSKEGIKHIVRKGADWKALTPSGQTVLHLAASSGNPEIIKYFVELGADINLKDKYGDMPIHNVQLAHHNYKNVLKTLVSCGAEIDATGRYGQTPLELALAWGMSEYDFQLIVNSAENSDG